MEMNNPMSMADYEIIKWLDDTSNDNGSLKYSWLILNEYYNICKEELKNISTDELPFESISDINSQYDFCKSLFKNNFFVEECFKFFGKDKVLEAFNILNNHDKENIKRNSEQEWIIAKIIRLYNMYLKLGHSARITYIAMYESDCVLKNNQNISNKNNIELFRNTITLSALLHDIGRFYQSAHYNSLVDREMIKKEGKIDNLNIDHAIAGYYYAIASSFELHKLLTEGNDEEQAKLCMEAIAATVVKFHQKANSAIPHLESSIDSSVLNSTELLNSIYNFINDAYSVAEDKKYYVSTQINEKHKKFIDSFISSISNIIKKEKGSIDFDIADGFLDQDERQKESEELESLSNDLLEKIKLLNRDNIDETTDYMIDSFKSRVDDVPEEEIISFKKKIRNTLEGMLNYDISKSIDDIFIHENERDYQIPDSMKFMLSTSLSMTMDADKIDIFNQRALGIYNVAYNPSQFAIFPTENDSLIDLLNNYYKFNRDKNPIIINSDVISVLNNFSEPVLDGVKEYLSDFKVLFNEDNNLRNDIEIYVYDDKVIINDGSKELKIETDKLSKMFTTNWFKFICTNFKEQLFEYDKKNNRVKSDSFSDPELLDFKQFKVKYINAARINVKNDILERNVANLSDDEKVSVYRDILVSEGLDYRFMKEGNNPPGYKWILMSNDIQSQHVVNSGVSGLIWQLNQFLFVNMRCVYSYKFIKDNNILDKIQEQYDMKSPIVAKVLKPYIDYAKLFIDQVLQMHANKEIGDILTSSIVSDIRKKISNSFLLDSKEHTIEKIDSNGSIKF